jgi:hypothetical protein
VKRRSNSNANCYFKELLRRRSQWRESKFQDNFSNKSKAFLSCFPGARNQLSGMDVCPENNLFMACLHTSPGSRF